MKFLKKSALAAASGTFPHHHFTDSELTDTFLSRCLRNLTKSLRTWKQRHDYSNPEIANPRTVSYKSVPVIDWAPLVKATFTPVADSENNRANCQNKTHHCLFGRSILCVGGRVKLYPEYSRLIKNHDGHFMVFHGSSRDNFENLPRFLKQADMIICPVDCVNHEAFFTVKQYCKYSGKPCVLLERSETKNFKAGIRMLARMLSG